MEETLQSQENMQENLKKQQKKVEIEQKIKEAQAAMIKAKANKDESLRAYQLAQGGNVASHLFKYIGILLFAGGLLTGAGFLVPFGAALSVISAAENKNHLTQDNARKKAAEYKTAEKEAAAAEKSYFELVNQLNALS